MPTCQPAKSQEQHKLPLVFLMSISLLLVLVTALLVERTVGARATLSEQDYGWNLQSLLTLDQGAGRYTQARTITNGTKANATIIVWNAVTPQPGLRLVHCYSNSTCSEVQAIANGESDPRFIRMELVQGRYPVIVHTANQDHELSLTYCGKHLQRLTLLKCINKVLYFDLIVHVIDEGAVIDIAATISNPQSGCDLITIRVSLECMCVLDQEVRKHVLEAFHIDETTALPVSGLENPILAGDALAYWDVSHGRLEMISGRPTQTSKDTTPCVIADNSTGRFSNPGAWTRMVQSKGILVVTFFDLQRHSLFVSQCHGDPSSCRCSPPQLVDDQAYHGDFTDFGAGGFPDFQINPFTGHPVLVYFVQETKERGCLRVMQCHDEHCSMTPNLLNATCGLAGYGRDASVAFPSANMAITSFLDLQGHDDPSYMQAKVAFFQPGDTHKDVVQLTVFQPLLA